MATYIRFAVGATGIIASIIAVLGASLLGDDKSNAPALPDPTLTGKMSLEEALAKRRSIRSFAGGELSARHISQLCWAAQGISEPVRRLRTCPSAGATYPLELYVVTA
ncbi:MAG: nitroreductase family protein, partial [Phycisphaerae bacterium]|nr:nitroreductase family protein [Phycisphaerae bacterium]